MNRERYRAVLAKSRTVLALRMLHCLQQRIGSQLLGAESGRSLLVI